MKNVVSKTPLGEQLFKPHHCIVTYLRQTQTTGCRHEVYISVQLKQQSVLQQPHYHLDKLWLVLRMVQGVHLLADWSWQWEVTHHLLGRTKHLCWTVIYIQLHQHASCTVLLLSCSLYLHPHSNQLQINSGNIKNLAWENIKLLAQTLWKQIMKNVQCFFTSQLGFCMPLYPFVTSYIQATWLGWDSKRNHLMFEVQCTATHVNNKPLPTTTLACIQLPVSSIWTSIHMYSISVLLKLCPQLVWKAVNINTHTHI